MNDVKSTTTIDQFLSDGNGNELTFEFALPVKKLSLNNIRDLIVELPGRPPAISDRNLAGLYGTTTKRLNEQLRRNTDWFDSDYYFELTDEETLVAKCDQRGRESSRPKMFNHYGCNAASSSSAPPRHSRCAN